MRTLSSREPPVSTEMPALNSGMSTLSFPSVSKRIQRKSRSSSMRRGRRSLVWRAIRVRKQRSKTEREMVPSESARSMKNLSTALMSYSCRLVTRRSSSILPAVAETSPTAVCCSVLRYQFLNSSKLILPSPFASASRKACSAVASASVSGSTSPMRAATEALILNMTRKTDLRYRHISCSEMKPSPSSSYNAKAAAMRSSAVPPHSTLSPLVSSEWSTRPLPSSSKQLNITLTAFSARASSSGECPASSRRARNTVLKVSRSRMLASVKWFSRFLMSSVV
mmetsp:Transcript_14014/g.41105  ORF Transcript_14014/g.41105 Transcript_14014/m.41105 type:complete len:281 (-) Transcript_14014:1504-2346(-)